MAKSKSTLKTHLLRGLVFFILAGVLIAFSVEIKPLDEVKKKHQQEQFKPDEYARDFWDHRLMKNLETAANAEEVIRLLTTDAPLAEQKFGRKVGMGQVHYYFLFGQGSVLSVNEETVSLSISEPPNRAEIEIATDYIFGHAVRNGSGLINVSDFSNMQDFNNVSEAINHIISTEVLPDFKEKVRPGSRVVFTGAAELADDQNDILPLKIIPVKLEILPKAM